MLSFSYCEVCSYLRHSALLASIFMETSLRNFQNKGLLKRLECGRPLWICPSVHSLYSHAYSETYSFTMLWEASMWTSQVDFERDLCHCYSRRWHYLTLRSPADRWWFPWSRSEILLWHFPSCFRSSVSRKPRQLQWTFSWHIVTDIFIGLLVFIFVMFHVKCM